MVEALLPLPGSPCQPFAEPNEEVVRAMGKAHTVKDHTGRVMLETDNLDNAYEAALRHSFDSGEVASIASLNGMVRETVKDDVSGWAMKRIVGPNLHSERS